MKKIIPTYLFPGLLAVASLHGQRQSENYSVGAETFAPLAGGSAVEFHGVGYTPDGILIPLPGSTYENIGAAEPITGLSLKDLPDVRDFAGFIGQLEPIDTDKDGLTDDEELALGTDPNKADTDGDGLTDKEEADLGTDPKKADTDGDGYTDGAEVNAGTLPLLASSNPNRPPALDGAKTFELVERQAIGTVVAHLKATDPDEDVVTFALASGAGSQHNGYFTLEANGTLRTKAITDHDVLDKLYARVRLSDGKGGSAEESLAIFVIEEPNRAPVLAVTKAHYVRENKPIGTVVAHLKATDPDGDAVTFALAGGTGSRDNGLFTLESNGTLKTKTIHDHETLQKLYFRVSMIDGKGATPEEALNVYVLNDSADDPETLAKLDDDDDGLTNGQEEAIGTDPNKADTDGDGFSDRAEVDAGTYPEDAFDFPGKPAPGKSAEGDDTGPDGRRYEVVKAGHSRSEAKQLAATLGGVLPLVKTAEMTEFLLKLLDEADIDTVSELEEIRAAWIGHPADEAVALSPEEDYRSVEFVEEEDSLAVILAFEKPQALLPTLRTDKPVILTNGTVKAKGQLLADGGERPGRLGFMLSERMDAKPGDEGTRVISAASTAGDVFEATIPRLRFDVTYYLRALAENSAGIHFGAFKRIRLDPEVVAPFDGQDQGNGWQESSWFGSFHWSHSRWIFHSELSWLYVSGNPPMGWWFWSEGLGWAWTSAEVYPYVWMNETTSWWYFMGKKGPLRAFYDYGAKEWKER